MAISEAHAGSENVTGTEHDLPSDTTSLSSRTEDGVYQVFLDCNTLVDGDQFRFRAYEKVQAGDTQRVFFSSEITNAQGANDNWVSPSFVLMHGWTFTLQRITATSRVITWSIRKVG